MGRGVATAALTGWRVKKFVDSELLFNAARSYGRAFVAFWGGIKARLSTDAALAAVDIGSITQSIVAPEAWQTVKHTPTSLASGFANIAEAKNLVEHANREHDRIVEDFNKMLKMLCQLLEALDTDVSDKEQMYAQINLNTAGQIHASREASKGLRELIAKMATSQPEEVRRSVEQLLGSVSFGLTVVEGTGGSAPEGPASSSLGNAPAHQPTQTSSSAHQPAYFNISTADSEDESKDESKEGAPLGFFGSLVPPYFRRR